MLPLNATDDLPPMSENIPPTINTTVESSPLASHPERLGPYKPLKKIGEGGMGVVYLAEQEHPRRQVALKVLKPGTASLERLRRFEHETRALARLQHDGIARIYQAGRIGEGELAQPYFVMEFIDGRPLTIHAESLGLDIPQRLGLMVRVCQAVQHAHLQGVVHRDLKPANILVEKGGQPKVLDFGVALVCDDNQARQTLQTAVGQLVGTVPYMSPEQAEADPEKVDWRSDIYALGVICYELLSGRLPHDLQGQSAFSAVRIIREEEPAPLSSINKVFRGDLNTIVAKALEKQRERRYQSAADLAADLERYLRDEPITARPAGPVYKFRKFVKRNKGKVGLAVLLLLALVVGIPLMAWAAIQRERADAAERENARLEAEGFGKAAHLAAQHGRWREALRNFDKALEAGHPNQARMRLGKARALLELNETDLCAAEIEELAEAAKQTKHEGSLLLLRGEMLLSKTDAQAERFLRAALAKQLLPGERAYAEALLAETAPQAVAHFSEVLALDPYHQRARINLEFLLLFLARFDEARSELRAHQVIFPDDDDLPMLQSLLSALEGKRAEAQMALTPLKDRLDAADLAAFAEVSEFLCQFRNRANRSDNALRLPDLSNHWQAALPALRRLWPALAVNEAASPFALSRFVPFFGRATRLAPPKLLLIARLPPRLRKNLEGLPRFVMQVVEGRFGLTPMSFVNEAARAAEILPEGTITYLLALTLFGAQRWEQANQTAEEAAEMPALLRVYPAAMNVAATTKAHLYILFRTQPDPLLLPRAVEATLLTHRPSFFAAAATHGMYFASRNALVPRAVANLREMLAAQQRHRPLIPDIAINLALLAGEYSLARQLLDDWERDAPGNLGVLYLRAITEHKAGAYLPALKAAEAYLKRKPDDASMQQFKKQLVQEMGERARHYLPDTLPKRKP